MQQLSFELLVRYLSGDATPEEALRIEDWRQESADNEQYFAELFSTWNDSLRYARPDKEKRWQQFSEKMNEAHAGTGIQKKRWFVLWKIAAALAVLIALGYGIFYYTRSETLTFTAFNNADTVVLPDATQAILDKAAVLTFSSDKHKNRILKLSGDAVFNITNHQSGLTLQLASGLLIKDIGTQFKVSQSAAAATITLYDGKLKIWSANDTVVLERTRCLHLIMQIESYL